MRRRRMHTPTRRDREQAAWGRTISEVEAWPRKLLGTSPVWWMRKRLQQRRRERAERSERR